MILFLAGPVYGNLDELYTRVAELADRVGGPDYILQTGNLGVYPDKHSVPNSMLSRGGGSDFARWYHEDRATPYPTIFIPGRYEDHRWLKQMLNLRRTELLPGLTWLVNGYSMDLGRGDELCTILSMGKIYSKHSYFEGGKVESSHLPRGDIYRSLNSTHGGIDILLLHDPQAKKLLDGVDRKLTVVSKRSQEGTNVDTIPLDTMEIVPILWEDRSWRYLVNK